VADQETDKVFIKDFVYTSVASFSFFSSFYLLLPIIPLFVVHLGGSPAEVGLALGIFPIASILARPFIGVFADVKGRKLFMYIGAIVFFLSALLYSAVTALVVLFLIRVFHGFGMASFTTSSAAYIADIAPKTRRGEAISYFATANNIALIIGPYIALTIVGKYGAYTEVFYVGAALALVSSVLIIPVTETARIEDPVKKFFDKTLYRREVIFPSMVIGVGALTYAVIIAFLPLHAGNIGVANPGIFFSTYGISLVISRILGSKILDRYPRPRVIIISSIPMLIAVALLAFTRGIIDLMVVAMLYGVGLAFLLPAAQVFLVDRVRKEERAKALGVFFSFLELGICGGAILLGIVADFFGYKSAFVTSAVIGALGMGVFSYGVKRNW
jgi:MFS family permease